MTKYIFYFFFLIPSLSYAGTITTNFSPLGTVVISSGTPFNSSISYVSSSARQDVTGTTLASLAAAAQNVTTGNMLVVGVTQGTDETVPTSVTDTAGNTFTHVTGADSTINGSSLISIWYNLNATGNSSDIITVNFNVPEAFDSIIARQYSTTGTGFTFDTKAIGSSGTSSPAVTASFSTAHPKETIVAFAATNSIAQTYSLGTIGGVSATNLVTSNTNGSAQSGGEDLITTTTQSTITAGMSYTGSNNNGISVATFNIP